MLSFWAYIDESDIEAFAGTLLLPRYMSHLSLAPFHFGNQYPNSDGRVPLILTYIGEGRVEEMSLEPEQHALDLLHYAIPALKRGMVQLPGQEAVWNWTLNGSKNQRHLDSHAGLHVYFEPIVKTLPSLSPESSTFSPFQTYVSVSRKELFLGSQVFSAYFQAWINLLTNHLMLENTASENIPLSFIQSESLTLDCTPNGFTFSTSKMGGELLLENDTVFVDLLRFAGLKEPLNAIADFVVPDLDSPETQIGEVGVLMKLAEKANS
ncbi:MAG: hypothetical protein ACRC10_12695 [Thermoguttaceae bacterium]